MSVSSAILNEVESKVPKVVDARMHGIIDYIHAAFFLSLAWAWRKSEPRAALASLLTGGYILGGALMTDYPLGAAKIIPFEVHGRLDAAFAGASFAVPKAFGFEGTTAARVFQGNGVAESTVVAMTDWDSERARGEEKEGAMGRLAA
jgi:hypothetical protein